MIVLQGVIHFKGLSLYMLEQPLKFIGTY